MVNPIQVQKYLKGIDYPVNKEEVVNTAKKEGADNNIISTLQKLPDQSFNSPKDISRAIGRVNR